MQRNRIIQLSSGTVAMLCLFTAGLLGPRINASAARHQLVYVDRAEENAPPQVALGIAMGALRGVFVNYLWIRANRLKEEGKFHEAMTLARAITTLQPRFPGRVDLSRLEHGLQHLGHRQHARRTVGSGSTKASACCATRALSTTPTRCSCTAS